MDAVMCRVRELEKLLTYPSPKPMSCPKWEVSVKVAEHSFAGGQR